MGYRSQRTAELDATPEVAPLWTVARALDELRTGGAALDLHEGILEPQRAELARGCQRWPETMRLRSSQGEVVRGRCGATNLCSYCQRLYVVETVEMLTLDALEVAPTIWVVLTAREHLTRQACYEHLRALQRVARKSWPEIEWFVQVEFQRRGALHLNLLIKGVPTADRERLLDTLSERWCDRVDAEPVGQWSGEVADAGGVVRYLSKMLAHGLKAEQAPPIGWKGHRTSQTRGYLVRPASVMRVEARESLRFKREVWRLSQAIDVTTGERMDPWLVDQLAERNMATAAATSWEIVQVEPMSNATEPPAWPRKMLRAPLPRNRPLDPGMVTTGDGRRVPGAIQWEGVEVPLNDFGVQGAAPADKFGAWVAPRLPAARSAQSRRRRADRNGGPGA